MSEELTIKKEKVLEAAKSNCTAVKRALKTLFPEAFEKPKPEIDLAQLKINPDAFTMLTYRSIFCNAEEAGFPAGLLFSVRNNGKFKNKAFFLDPRYNWKLAWDEHVALNLIPSHISFREV